MSEKYVNGICFVSAKRVSQLQTLANQKRKEAKLLFDSGDEEKQKAGISSSFFADCIDYILTELQLEPGETQQ